MDFNSLARRDLQALCKKNKIPANLTNLAMADALKSLKSIEWDEEIKQKLMPQSETIEQNRSPLPGSRRVAARISMEEINDKEEEMKKEALIEGTQTPATAVRRSSRLQSAMSTRTRARTSAIIVGTGTSATGTRTRKGKKEEAPAEAVDSVVVETPAPGRGRKKAVETPSEVVAPRSSARPLRQSTRRLAESTNRARTTRTVAKNMTLDPDHDKEAHTGVEGLELEKEQTELQKETTMTDTAPEQEQEAKTDVAELGEATEPNSSEKLELAENLADENQIPAEKDEEAVEEGDELKDGNLSIEKSVEQVTEVGSDANAALISEEVAPEEEESEVNQTTIADSPILGLLSEVMPENNSDLQAAPSSDFTLEPPTEKCIASPIRAPADQVCLADSLVMEHVSEAITENNTEPPCDITLDAQVAPSELCFSSPVRAGADQGVEKMLDSVVRHFARASINDSARKIEACVGQKEEKDKVASDVSGLVQNENTDKGIVDLNSMSLRKLKVLYKNKLIEVNSAKVVKEEKRLPLGKLDENLQV